MYIQVFFLDGWSLGYYEVWLYRKCEVYSSKIKVIYGDFNVYFSYLAFRIIIIMAKHEGGVILSLLYIFNWVLLLIIF